MKRDDLPLFSWEPAVCQVRPFPLARIKGKVRDVAAKMAARRSDRHREQYHAIVESSLRMQLGKALQADEIDREIASFWTAVELEMRRTPPFRPRPA